MEPMAVGHCHCEDCRKSSGTGHCTHVAVQEDALSLSGAVTAFEKPADSGNLVSRHFCGTCGSPVYSTNAAQPGSIFLRASILNQLEKYTAQLAVWTNRATAFDPVDKTLMGFEAEIPPEVMAEMMAAE
jgi:hypothetical protein